MRKTLLVAVAALVLAGCSGSEFDTFGETLRDADVARRDDSPADIIQMPHGYSNLAAKCDGTTRVYATKNDNGRAVAVSPDHPSCGGGR